MDSRVHGGILGIKFHMKTVVRWRSHNLAWVGNGAQKADISEPMLRGIRRDLLDPRLYLIEMRDDWIADGQWPTHLWYNIERRCDVTHEVSLDQSKLVIVETAQTHC